MRSVAPGSSGTLAGVQAGDLLTHLNGQAIGDLPHVRALLRQLRAGDALQLGVLRRGQRLELEGTVAAFPVEQYPDAECLLDQVEVDGHALRALCVRPRGEGPFPVVYYLPGAHWASEEHPLDPEHPVPALIAALARLGVATLRVERSGVGDSQGPSCTRVDYHGELAGYRAGLQLLRRSAWADDDRLMLFGHSLGAMLAPQLAELSPVQAMVVFGAGAVPIAQALIEAIERHAQLTLGSGTAVVERSEQIAELIRLVVCGQRTPAEVFAQRPDLAAIAPSHFHHDQAYQRVVSFYHQLQARDIAASWQRYAGPTLALHGGGDYVTSRQDAAQIVEWVGEAAQLRELPGVDHHMSDAAADKPPRLASALRAAVLDWVRQHLL